MMGSQRAAAALWMALLVGVVQARPRRFESAHWFQQKFNLNEVNTWFST